MGSPSPSSRSQPAVESLRSIAMKEVSRYFISARGVLELMRYFEEIDWMIEEGPELKQKCIDFIKSTYPCMRKKHSKQLLEEMIGEDLVSRLDSDRAELMREIKKTKIHGSVLERSSSLVSPATGNYTRQPSGLKRSVSVSGKAAYPYESLQAGRDWPSDVNPKRREEHLNRDEFQDIFSMSYDTYRSYPTWKRAQIKKEKNLF